MCCIVSLIIITHPAHHPSIILNIGVLSIYVSNNHSEKHSAEIVFVNNKERSFFILLSAGRPQGLFCFMQSQRDYA